MPEVSEEDELDEPLKDWKGSSRVYKSNQSPGEGETRVLQEEHESD